MKLNTNSFKRCIGSLAFISACTLSAHALAEDQVYSCIVVFNPVSDGTTFGQDTLKVFAPSVDEAKARALKQYSSTAIKNVKITSCTLAS